MPDYGWKDLAYLCAVKPCLLVWRGSDPAVSRSSIMAFDPTEAASINGVSRP